MVKIVKTEFGQTVGMTYPEETAEAVPEETAETVYTCPECGKEYKTEEGLNKHITEKHA